MTTPPLLDPAIFDALTRDLEEETRVSEALTQAVRSLNQAVGAVQGQLSRVHSTPRTNCASSGGREGGHIYIYTFGGAVPQGEGT
jgi:hypothetical protein